MAIHIKDTLIKLKNKEIYDIEERISDLKREISDNQTEIQDLEDEISEIKKYIADFIFKIINYNRESKKYLIIKLKATKFFNDNRIYFDYIK